MTGSKIQHFDLFKAAMGNPEYLTAIIKDPESQASFLKTLEKRPMTFQNILDSIKIVSNPQVKSLLITYLLCQEHFLANLKGDSLLNRLLAPKNHIPSRLNGLVHQLDLKTLSPSMISKLQPEAAVSILCSVPHFHQLSGVQIDALIQRYPKHELISYWMNYLATMPNAYYVLAHLIKCVPSNVFDALKKMESQQKERIIITIIEHLELFNHIPKAFFYHANKESHLILAIRLYLNGHANKTTATYINYVTKKLLDNKNTLSLTATELLFSINDDLAFKEIQTRTAYYTNRYVRTQAQKGSCALFYHNNQINIWRMIQNIHLHPLSPKEIEDHHQTPEKRSENPFIREVIKRNKSINCFEYFLTYYRGSSEAIGTLLNDYMSYYEQPQNSTNRSLILHHLRFMMTRPELDLMVKEALFTAFTNHPALFDEQIRFQLFLYDANRIILYFGLCGGATNYQHVIDICTAALKNLNPVKHQELILIAQNALSEAQQELIFTKEQGFFSSLIKKIKRCWIYGWSGFFRPNLPKYVIPESSAQEENNRMGSQVDREHVVIEQPYKNDLPTLLHTMGAPVTEEQFEEIIKALDVYSLEVAPPDELSTRQKLHNLYHEFMNKNENDPLSCWLKKHQHPFIRNQFRLLELLLQKIPRLKIDASLKSVDTDSKQLQDIFDELNCIMPELVVKATLKSVKKSDPADLVANTKKIFSEYATEATGYAKTAWHWAGSFFKKIKHTEAEEELFEVEHIDSFNATMNKT